MHNPHQLRYQRNWRTKITHRLKAKLGFYCHGCTTEHAIVSDIQKAFLELVIPDRQSPDLKKYGQNTVTIYNHILTGKLPEDIVTLLCPDCKWKLRQGDLNAQSDKEAS